MTHRLISAVITLLLAFAGVQGGRGAWIYVKAEMAQYLLHRSWERTLAGEEQVRPWPWADAWPVARLLLEDGAGLIVLGGASGRNLAFAPGHLDGSGAPGGVRTCVVAGHRDTHFSRLDSLEIGQRLTIEDADGHSHAYRVIGAEVVDESETWVINERDNPTLVLVTCWPLDAVTAGGSLRYVVWAEYVETVKVQRVDYPSTPSIGRTFKR